MKLQSRPKAEVLEKSMTIEDIGELILQTTYNYPSSIGYGIAVGCLATLKSLGKIDAFTSVRQTDGAHISVRFKDYSVESTTVYF